MKNLFVFVFLLTVLACHTHNKTEQENNIVSVHHTVNTPFNEAFARLMTDYYHVKENFYVENDSLIHQFSRKMIKDADSLQFNSFAADTAIIEKGETLAASISGELQGLLGESNLENKRRSFYTLSEQLYELIKTVQYNREPIYHFNCELAFEQSGATWLSNTMEKHNPYLPKGTTACAEIIDTLNFTK